MIRRFLGLILALTLGGTLTAHASLDDGLVASYPFNGNAHDVSHNNLHGMVSGCILTNE